MSNQQNSLDYLVPVYQITVQRHEYTYYPSKQNDIAESELTTDGLIPDDINRRTVDCKSVLGGVGIGVIIMTLFFSVLLMSGVIKK